MLHYQIKLWWRTFTEDQYEKPHKTWLLCYWLILKITEISICFWSSYFSQRLVQCCFSWKKYFTFRRRTASWVKLLHGSNCRDAGKETECSCSSSNKQLHLTAFIWGNKDPRSFLCFMWMLLPADVMHHCWHPRRLCGKGCVSQEEN